MGRAVVLLLIAIPLTIPRGVQAEEQHPPYEVQQGASEGILGSYLEEAFQIAQGQCIHGTATPTNLSISKSSFWGTRSVELSAIPPQLFDPSLQVNEKAAFFRGESIARAFAQVYEKPQLTMVDRSEAYLITDYIQDPATMIQSGFDSAVYDYNCTASFALSMKLNSGWTFPMTNVTSALDADATGKTEFHIALVSGKFQSPIWAQYKSITTHDRKVYAALLMWDWYLRNPSALGDNTQRYLLTAFDGVGLFRVSTVSRASGGKFSAAAAFSAAGFLNMDSALKAAYESSSRAEVKSYGLAVRKPNGKESHRFDPFPTPALLVTQLSEAKARLEANPAVPLAVGSDIDHVQVITGVPQTVCERGWDVELADGADKAGTLSVLPSVFVPPADGVTLPTCKIPVRYVHNKNTDRVTLDYFLATSLVDGSGNAKAVARIRADKVSLSASGNPKIQVSRSKPEVDGPPRISKSGSITFSSYSWTLDYPVQEDAAAAVKIKDVDMDTDSTQIVCGARKLGAPATWAAASYRTATGTSGTLRIVITHDARSDLEKLDMADWEPCVGEGTANFRLQDGRVVSRKIPPTTLLYQRATPVQAAVRAEVEAAAANAPK